MSTTPDPMTDRLETAINALRTWLSNEDPIPPIEDMHESVDAFDAWKANRGAMQATVDPTPTPTPPDRTSITAHVTATMPGLTTAGLCELAIALDDLARRHPRDLSSGTLAEEQRARESGYGRSPDGPGDPGSDRSRLHFAATGAAPLVHDDRPFAIDLEGTRPATFNTPLMPLACPPVAPEDAGERGPRLDANEPRIGAPLPEPCPLCGKTLHAFVDAKGWWHAEKCPSCNGSWWFQVPRPTSEIPAVRS